MDYHPRCDIINVVGQLTCGTWPACVSGPRLRAGRVGDAGGVCCVNSPLAGADLAAGLVTQSRGICAPLAAAAAAVAVAGLEGARVAGEHRPKAVLEVARPGHCRIENKVTETLRLCPAAPSSAVADTAQPRGIQWTRAEVLMPNYGSRRL
jgi:hypothetical protein